MMCCKRTLQINWKRLDGTKEEEGKEVTGDNIIDWTGKSPAECMSIARDEKSGRELDGQSMAFDLQR